MYLFTNQISRMAHELIWRCHWAQLPLCRCACGGHVGTSPANSSYPNSCGTGSKLKHRHVPHWISRNWNETDRWIRLDFQHKMKNMKHQWCTSHHATICCRNSRFSLLRSMINGFWPNPFVATLLFWQIGVCASLFFGVLTSKSMSRPSKCLGWKPWKFVFCWRKYKVQTVHVSLCFMTF